LPKYLIERGFCKSHVILKKEIEFLTTAPYPSIPCLFEGTKEFTPEGDKGSHCYIVDSCPLRGKDVRRTGRGLLLTISTFAKASILN
jgi:hypothetical protein